MLRSSTLIDRVDQDSVSLRILSFGHDRKKRTSAGGGPSWNLTVNIDCSLARMEFRLVDDVLAHQPVGHCLSSEPTYARSVCQESYASPNPILGMPPQITPTSTYSTGVHLLPPYYEGVVCMKDGCWAVIFFWSGGKGLVIGSSTYRLTGAEIPCYSLRLVCMTLAMNRQYCVF